MTKDTLSRVHVATVGAPFGIKGAFRLKTFTEDPKTVLKSPLKDEKGQDYVCQYVRVEGPQTLVVTCSSIKDRTAAEAFRGTKLFMDEANFPSSEELLQNDQFYVKDLEGMTVVDTAKNPLGTVVQVVNYGASDILVVKTPEGEKQIAFIKESVLAINKDECIVEVEKEHLI